MNRYFFVIRQAFGTVLVRSSFAQARFWFAQARFWIAQARCLSEATPNE